jgi:hypothetical protein
MVRPSVMDSSTTMIRQRRAAIAKLVGPESKAYEGQQCHTNVAKQALRG